MQSFFREVTLRVCGNLDIEAALASVLEYLRGHLPIMGIGLGYSDLEAKRIEVVATATIDAAIPLWRDDEHGIELNEAGLGYVRSESAPSPLVANRPSEVPPGLAEIFPGLQRCSAIFVRLRLSAEEVGALVIWAEGHDQFDQQHVAMVSSVEEPMTIALVNARRYLDLLRLKELLADDNRALRDDLRRAVGMEVIGADFGLRSVMEQVRRIAPSRSPALLLGETGTGKEVIANAIVALSSRSQGPYVTLQCGAVPDTLLDSELFGHEAGAFTGAARRKRGRFERADGGTLFLDEIGELSPEAQVKLLRVLQEARFERVGGTETIRVDVRVIAATHRDLEQMVRDGTFREDLWYRLNVLPIRIPPLRMRREDIPSLVQHFVVRMSQEMNRRVPRISPDDLRRLQAHDWPGNVRELQNRVERALILSSGDEISFSALDLPRRASPSSTPLPNLLSMDQAIAAHIRGVLAQTRWKVSGPGGAAEVLGMNESTLRFRMKKLGISRYDR